MPDIVITPNRGTTNNPKIDFTGTSAGTIKLEVLGDGTIAWNGANGSLFSIADSLSGSLMSVNDISGLPAFEVFSDNRVVVGQFGANLLLGKTTSSSNGRLQLTSHTTNTGGIGFGSDVTLFRSAADILKTEDSFHVNGEIYALASGGGLKLSASSTTGLIVALQGGGIQLRNSSNANILTLADNGNVTVNSGTLTATQLISNIAQGTAPLVVTSTTQVSNLNAQYLNGYSSDTANTANAIVRRDGSGFINATAIQTSSGGSNGVRVHTNSGITASNNYMNFFTSQTSGWAFNANGTGADTNNVAVVTSGGNVGIGQTSPLQTLQLKNNGWIGIGASTGSYIPTSWQRGGNGGIILSSSANADGSGWSYGSRLVQVDYGNGLGLSIDVNYASSWTNDALFISGRSTSLGNVGIGTTDPAAKLDVNGSFKHGLVYRYPNSQIAPALNSTGWIKLATIPNNSRAKFLMRNGSANSEEVLDFDVYSTYYNSGVYVTINRNTYNYHLSEIQVQGADGQQRIVYVKCRTSDYSPTFTWQVESWNGAATIHNTEETPTSGKNFAIGTTNYLHSNYVPNVYFDGSVGIGKIPSTKFNIKEQNTGTEGFIIANWNNVNTVLVGSDASTGGGKFTLKNNSGTANIFINSAGDSYLNGGNVGIGTTSPSAKLDVYYENSINTTTPGMTMYNLHLTPSVRTAGNAVGITFGADTGSGTTPQAGIYSQFSGSYGTKMYFATTDAYVSGAKTRMVIDHNGYLSTPTGSQLSYQDSTSYTVWSSEPEYSIVDDATDSNYKVMKTFVAEKSGSLRVKFSAYIISGTYYFAWRIRKNSNTNLATGNYQAGLDTGQVTSVHAYRRFSALISVNPGDIITVEMVSSDGSGNPVNGNGQTLYLKELRIYNSIPESTYGSSNVFGDYVGIGTTTPTSRLEVNGTVTAPGAVINYPYGDAFPLQLTGTSFLKANANYYGMLIRSGDANYLSGALRIVGGSNKRVELYSYEETVGARNVVFPMGNVGVNEVNPIYKLHVSGDAYISTNLHANGTLRAGNVETASFATAFTHNVANRATDIRFPNTYINGLIEIEVTSSYSNQNSVGVVKKIFSVGANPNNTIWNSTIARVVEAHGVAADNWTIGDFAWDSVQSCYIIPVYHIVSTGNTVNINIRYFSQSAVSTPVLITTTVSAEYTATIPAAYQTRHYVYYNDRLGIGTSAPSTLFQVASIGTGNFRLDTNGSGGHYYQGESNARLGLGRDLITSAGHISFTMAGGSVNTLGAAITMPANSQLGFYTSNGSSLIERVRIDGSGNVGVNSTNPSTLLNVQGSFATRNFKVFTWSTLSANATQARRYEIARLGHDTVNWDSTGVFEVEIYQQYYSRPVKKRYMVSYGYPGGGVAKLVEYQNSSTSGYGANNFQVTLGTEVVTSGNFKYLPVYIDIRYYAIIDVRVNTNWNHSTTNSSPGAALAYINESPSPTNISDFTADSVVSLTSDNNAVFESSVGVGISTTPNYKLEISGTVGLSGFSGGSYRKLATPSYWGYNNAYKSIILGSSSTTYNTNDGAVTLCFGVDISGNASGSFIGDGRELVFRNLTRFVTPNGSNDNYLNPLTFNNGSVGIAIDSPSFKFQVAGAGSIGDGAFIVSGNTASSSFYDQNTGAYLHTPGAMIRKDSSRTTPQTSEATLVLYNKNGTDATNTKLVFASNETTSTSANPVATAAIVSEKVSGTAGGWAVGNLQFLVKNGANYTNSVVVDNTGVTVAGALTVQDGTESTNIFGLKTFTKSLTVTTSWSDVGISGSDLASGTYIIQVTVDNYDVSGGQYQERYSGVMSWAAGGTNSTDVDEIVLHKAGHAPNGNWINLRTVRQLGSGAGVLKLQIIASGNTSAADNYVFKFRRMI